MKNPSFGIYGILLGAVLYVWGCGGDRTEGQYIAKVNNSVLTYEMLRQRLDTSAAIEPQVRELTQNWVNNELLYQEAINRGYEDVPAVTQPLQEIKRQLAVNVFLQKEVYEKVALSVSPGEEQQYYNTHKQEFLLGEDKIKLSYLVFGNRDAATGFRAEVVRGTPWNEALARLTRNKESKVVLESAESQFFTQSTLAPVELWKILQTLNLYEVSFPVKTPVGFYILYLQGKQTKGEIAVLESVQNEIRQRIIMEKRQRGVDSLLTDLRKKNAVRMNLSTIPPTGEPVQQ
ncbi:MAG: peptidylprolyl isomerase [Bacteroidota bacterium]